MPVQPPPEAIAALKADHSLAAEFERKYGEGSSKAPINDSTKELMATFVQMMQAVTDYHRGPKKFTRDKNGDLSGFEPAEPAPAASLHEMMDKVLAGTKPVKGDQT